MVAELRRRGLREESGKSKLVQTRARVERRWRAIRVSLIREGRPDLAQEVERFLDAMLSPRTSREQIACELATKVLNE